MTPTIRAVCALCLATLAHAPHARAAEIQLWTARALATVLAEVGHRFERETGHDVIVSVGLPGEFAARMDKGEHFDVMITGPALIDELIEEGEILAESRTDIARSGIGVEVRAGAAKPDIASVEAFKRALLDAKSIAYLKNVGSGLYVADLLERLGIADDVKAKVIRPEGDVVSEMVARGEVEIGMVVITQILTTPGVDLVGPLPTEIQSYVVFSAGVSEDAKNRAAARELIAFLTGPGAVPVIRAQGMQPAEEFAR